MKTYKVYVAGRVSSDPNYKEKFSRYCKMIEASSTKDIKYIAVNPTAQAGFEDESLSFYQHIKLDFQHLIKCDIILLTSGWENSKGCNMEYAFACGTNKIILEAEKVPVYNKDTKTYYGTIDAAYNDSDNAIFDFEESINKYNERQSLKDKYMEECSVKWDLCTDYVEIPEATPINTPVSPEELKDISAMYATMNRRGI